MASYNDINVPVSVGTKYDADNDITIDRADDGTVRGRVGFADTLYTFQILHSIISSTDKDAIWTFYNANKAAAWTFTYQGDTYTLRFIAPPAETHLKGDWWKVVIRAIGTRN